MRRGERRQWWKSQSSFWSALLFTGLALGYSFATGPFRAADESSHFFRAYAISEGSVIAERPRPDLLGSYLPKSIPKLVTILADFPKDPAILVQPGRLEAARWLSLRQHNRDFVHFPGAAMHSPLVYLPATLGILFGRLLGLSPLLLFYLARCCNALAVGAALGWGISRLWRRAPFLASVALFPMTLAQVGSVTADAVTFGATFCWLADLLSRPSGENPESPSRWRWLLYAVVLSQLLFPYPILGLLVFSLPPEAIAPTRAGRLRFHGLFLFLLILPCVSWQLIIQHLQVQMRPLVRVDAFAQLSYVLGHPFDFIRLMLSSLWSLGPTYWHETVGVLGWLDFPIPGWILAGITVCLLVTTSSSDTHRLRLTPQFRLACFGLGAGGLIVTALLVYMTWNEVGSLRIEGWQGRYSLPLLPLILLAAANRLGQRATWLPKAALAFSVMANFVVLFLFARATYWAA